MKAEFNFVDVAERAKKALKIKSDFELAEKINMKPTTFNSRKKANSLPYEEFLIMANSEKLDFNWLLTGEGEMKKCEPATSKIVNVLDSEILYRAIKMSEELLDENHRVMNPDNKAKLVIATYELLRRDKIEIKPLLQLIRAAA